MPEDSDTEAGLNRAVYALRGLAGLLTALAHSKDKDCVDFECVGELAFLVAEQAQSSSEGLIARLYAR